MSNWLNFVTWYWIESALNNDNYCEFHFMMDEFFHTLVLFIVKLLWSLCCMRRSLNTVSVSRLLLTAVVLCLSCSQRIKSSCCPPQAAGSWPSAQGPSNGWEMSSSRETHDYYIKWVCLHSAFLPMQMFRLSTLPGVTRHAPSILASRILIPFLLAALHTLRATA